MNIEKCIDTKIDELNSIIKQKEEDIRKAPKGFIRACSRSTYYEYYLRDNVHDKNGKYIKKEQVGMAQKIVQRDYDIKVIDSAKENLQRLEKMKKINQENTELVSVYTDEPKAKRRLITPVAIPIDMYCDRWVGQKYEGLEWHSESKRYKTNKGLEVRSKSEAMIANLLDKLNVLYLYEKPLLIRRGFKIYPDFTLLKLPECIEVYYEHFGLLDEIDYRNDMLTKIRMYEHEGIFLGERLIVSSETYKTKLDIDAIENRIKHIMDL